jgi:hypothetical protein
VTSILHPPVEGAAFDAFLQNSGMATLALATTLFTPPRSAGSPQE